MPIIAASFCPHPPLLIPEVASGAAGELEDLRAACQASLAATLAGCDAVTVLGAGPTPGRHWAGDSAGDWAGDWGTLAGFGVRPSVASSPAHRNGARPGDGPVPLSLTIGAWLLQRAGWTGPTVGLVTDGHRPTPGAYPDPDLDHDADLDVDLDPDRADGTGPAPRTALLVMGDGAPSRSVAAPGHLDLRAEPYDLTVAAALTSGDPERLAALDTELAAALGVAGWPAWRAAAELLAGRRWTGELRYAAAPYGVGYFVADWHLSDERPMSAR